MVGPNALQRSFSMSGRGVGAEPSEGQHCSGKERRPIDGITDVKAAKHVDRI